jgi:hypothetical protein
VTDNGPGQENDPPQLHIWDAAAREFELGALIDGEDTWALFVVVERTSRELCRGRISFRDDDTRFDTDAILVEDSEEAVLTRAGNLPATVLRQLLQSIRK